MPWQSCDIIFNSGSTDCFYAGDIITGTVVVNFQQKQKIERFNLDVVGISKASWTRPMPTIPYIKVYSDTGVVLNINSDIFPELQGKTIVPGTYIHPFYFSLPPDLPSSFKSSIAKVFYFIKVQCKAAYKFKKKTSAPFNVLRNVDVNHLDEFLVPTFTEMHKIFWDSTKLSMQLQTHTGFAPNQIVSFEVMICNESRVKLSKLSITLVREIEYNVSSGYLKQEKKVENVTWNKFKNEEKEVCNLSMKIPPTNPSSNYSMIKIEYKFSVTLDFPYHFSVHKEIPVTISTVPVMHVELFK
ncbi:arrestin domain-containing protein 5-like isoform X1 [Leguminivora glycinivorella]|uniref:arrestin domain-containing protein 5-like isoform X1 n=1 Tax=Leguminivora glycinivorella TaxID=1035111 RepID=UPI00200BE384|nr:arrestin domain-containing protein 5-like isoform X1 [Leguminivora glycinivorella]